MKIGQICAAFIAASLLFIGVAASIYDRPMAKLLSRDQSVLLAIADTPESQSLGLSGRDSMSNKRGMLFVFERPAKTCFWMKDMRFPLDIIWLDSEYQVVRIEPNLAPDSYPREFCPPVPAAYVIELNSGQAEALGIRTESFVNLSL